MSRLCAIAMLFATVCFPAFASQDERVHEEEPMVPAAAAVAEAADLFASEDEWIHEGEQMVPAAAAQGLADLPPEILAKLDRDAIVEILLAREEAEYYNTLAGSSVFHQVEIIVPLACFFTILLVVISTLVLRYRRHAQTQETLRLMIEKGAEIPPELLTPPVSQYSDLRRGLILMGVGLSLSILIGSVEGFGSGSWAVGLIPAFIGASYLFVWRYSQRAGST